MNVREKMVKAYLSASNQIKFDKDFISASKAFHRNKTTAFFVTAVRMSDQGTLPDGQPYQELHTISKY